MTDQERLTALEVEVATLKSDVALLGAQLTRVKAEVGRNAKPPVLRGGEPVFG